ncbi:type II toxin-antitoxin system VapC family toxin [Brevundimonas sp.]|uniref:type II toxin-antitoxin system VapC family toxin n=1 Tax=Brevundimonas sp. TaxID=1871086 RepID=UPI002FDA5E98
MSVYFDTSAVVALLTDDAHSAAVEGWLVQGHDIVVSHWVLTEFSSALGLQFRQQRLSLAEVEQAEAALQGLVQEEFGLEAVENDDLVQARALLIRDRSLRSPDALHLSIAMRLGTAFATFDINQARAAERLGLVVLSA